MGPRVTSSTTTATWVPAARTTVSGAPAWVAVHPTCIDVRSPTTAPPVPATVKVASWRTVRQPGPGRQAAERIVDERHRGGGVVQVVQGGREVPLVGEQARLAGDERRRDGVADPEDRDPPRGRRRLPRGRRAGARRRAV